MKEKEPEIKFEKALGELKGIVEKLEKGELELDDSLRLFERGVKLMQVCSRKLEEAERRVKVVLKDAAGGRTVRDFAEETGKAEDPWESEGEEGEK